MDPFQETQDRLFKEKPEGLYLGGEPISKELLEALKAEAIYIKNSRLWAIVNGSLSNEAYRLALSESKQWDHVLYAKAMQNCVNFINKIIHSLAKK